MNILINGAGGRMGRALTALLEENRRGFSLAGRVDPFVRDEGILPSLSAFEGEAHCVIDVSNHTGVGPLLDWAIAKRTPVVICTTGHTDGEQEIIRSAAEQLPLFFSGNLSLGIALLTRLVRVAAEFLPDADIEIVEHHHSTKTDVPSGTALMLARAVGQVRPDALTLVGRRDSGRRSPREIGIHSLRLGSSAGIHEVLLDTGSQIITLRHEARDPSVYAEGALAAAAFLQGKAPGLYTMDDWMAERRASL